MARPSLDELMDKTDSRYSLVVAAAKRARILVEEKHEGIIDTGTKPVTVALQEIAAGKVKCYSTRGGMK
ncbi:MAG: DNA-directed RNA polymerase subunit omega [Peptococcaceae bacterium]|nr:DNA-directed RNA polymerase subunit omega [Peptococcaceae bacterium]